jgi:hypothetical protein
VVEIEGGGQADNRMTSLAEKDLPGAAPALDSDCASEEALRALIERKSRPGDRYLDLLQGVRNLAQTHTRLWALARLLAEIDALPLSASSTDLAALAVSRPPDMPRAGTEVLEEFVALARAVRARTAGSDPQLPRAEPVVWGLHHYHFPPEYADADRDTIVSLGLSRFLTFAEPAEQKALLSSEAYLRILWQPQPPASDGLLGFWWQTSGDPVRGVYLVNRLRSLAAACASHRAALVSAWSKGLILGEINIMPKNIAFFFRFAADGTPVAPVWPKRIKNVEYFG